jgi:hypothetical protein
MKGVDVMQSNASIEIKNQVKADLESRIRSEEHAIDDYRRENEYHQKELKENEELIAKSNEKIEVLNGLIAELGIE